MICPLTDFFARYGLALGAVILLFMGSYRLTDFTMGSMTNSFYIDSGYTLSQIAAVVKAYGLDHVALRCGARRRAHRASSGWSDRSWQAA